MNGPYRDSFQARKARFVQLAGERAALAPEVARARKALARDAALEREIDSLVRSLDEDGKRLSVPRRLARLLRGPAGLAVLVMLEVGIAAALWPDPVISRDYPEPNGHHL